MISGRDTRLLVEELENILDGSEKYEDTGNHDLMRYVGGFRYLKERISGMKSGLLHRAETESFSHPEPGS